MHTHFYPLAMIQLIWSTEWISRHRRRLERIEDLSLRLSRKCSSNVLDYRNLSCRSGLLSHNRRLMSLKYSFCSSIHCCCFFCSALSSSLLSFLASFCAFISILCFNALKYCLKYRIFQKVDCWVVASWHSFLPPHLLLSSLSAACLQV